MRLENSWVLVSFSSELRQIFAPSLKFQNDFLKVLFRVLYVLDIHSVWHRGSNCKTLAYCSLMLVVYAKIHMPLSGCCCSCTGWWDRVGMQRRRRVRLGLVPLRPQRPLPEHQRKLRVRVRRGILGRRVRLHRRERVPRGQRRLRSTCKVVT